VAHSLGFNTLFSLRSLHNPIRNLSHAFRISILHIEILPLRKMSRVRKIPNVNPILITIKLFIVSLYYWPVWHFSHSDWCSNDMTWLAWSEKELTISQRVLTK
jgi:hypothetical protein